MPYFKVFYLGLLLVPLLFVGEGLSKDVDRGIVSKTMIAETGERLENPIPFQQNGEQFYYAATTPEGSGGFITETVFWVAPDGTLHPILFDQAGLAYERRVNEGEFILAGGAGILLSNGRLRFEFFIANEGDPHCCPTAGKISGTYTMVGAKQFHPGSKKYSSTYRLVADTYRRDPISSGELAAYGP